MPEQNKLLNSKHEHVIPTCHYCKDPIETNRYILHIHYLDNSVVTRTYCLRADGGDDCFNEGLSLDHEHYCTDNDLTHRSALLHEYLASLKFTFFITNEK